MEGKVKWIKIVTDIFDDEKILLIENMPDGDCIIVLWFKLLCLAGKQNNGGVFILTDTIPYTDEMLATIFRRPVNTVRLALEVFERFGMIERIENVITIPNWGKHQSLDSAEKRRERDRIYQQNRRNALRTLGDSTESSDNRLTSADASPDVALLEEEREEDIEEEYILSDTNVSDCRTKDVRRAVDAWNQIGISSVSKLKAGSTRYKMLNARIKEYGIDKVLEAIGKVQHSSFLQGSNNRGWVISFDWFVKPNNFVKVLDGNYDDRRGSPSQAHQNLTSSVDVLAQMVKEGL
jgi:predicted phage replisome organizer